MNQYVIYRVKDTEIGKKLKHMPYNELGELVQEVKAENYEQIYFGLLEDNKKPYQLRKDLEKQIEPGKKLEVGDVIVTNREGLAVSHYVDTDTLLTLPGFINLTDSDAVIKVDTEDYEIEQYPGKWRSVDYLIFEGKSYFLMENQKYGKDAAALVLNQYGKVILDECKDGFDQDTIGNTLGYLGWTTSVSVGNTMALTGYAGEHAYELWEGIGQIKSTSGSFLRYTADSSGGMSGGAIYLTIQMKAAGFNHGGYPGESYNYGVKINSSIANEMNYYKNKN